jgi:hypothetical protein
MNQINALNLNLGCGFRKKQNFINVDLGDFCKPDVICNLATEAWPWPTSSASEVHFEFSLEQMGEGKIQLQHMICELFRVCQNNCKIFITCLHPRHDQFVLNPMCTQRISVEFFYMLSMANNLQQIGSGRSDNCLALEWGVNFQVANFQNLLNESIHQFMTSGQITEEQLRQRMNFENNLVQALEIELQVIKSTKDYT